MDELERLRVRTIVDQFIEFYKNMLFSQGEAIGLDTTSLQHSVDAMKVVEEVFLTQLMVEDFFKKMHDEYGDEYPGDNDGS